MFWYWHTLLERKNLIIISINDNDLPVTRRFVKEKKNTVLFIEYNL